MTEESIEEEIRKAEAGQDDGDSSEEEDEEEPDRAKELFTAKEQMCAQLEYVCMAMFIVAVLIMRSSQAIFASSFSLDFISLLLSKDTPVQASMTISNDLRTAVGLGTLGADKIQDSKVTHAQRLDTANIVKGWKLQSLNENADSILEAATKLEKEIEAETKYWQQLIEVDAKGWSICKVPQEQHTLGVRVGFAECTFFLAGKLSHSHITASAAFSNRSIAALRRQDDGRIVLDQGIAASSPSRLRVRVQAGNRTTGEYVPPKVVPSDSTVLPLILRARDANYTDELWQELNREARSLLNHGVICSGTAVTYATLDRTIIIDLVPGEESTELPPTATGKDNNFAQGVCLSLHLLLSRAHREKYRARTQPPRPLDNAPATSPPLNLLRPMIRLMTHQRIFEGLRDPLYHLSTVLVKAKLATPISVEPTLPHPSQVSSASAEKALDALFGTFSIFLSLPITASETINVTARTTAFPVVETQCLVTALNNDNKSIITPPGPFSGPGSLNELKSYFSWAVSCCLAADFIQTESPESAGTSEWSTSNDPRIIVSEDGTEVGFAVKIANDHARIGVRIKRSGRASPARTLLWSSKQDEGESRGLKDAINAVLTLDIETPDAAMEG